jgi:Zn ribbon nucleic-acid-binding protein
MTEKQYWFQNYQCPPECENHQSFQIIQSTDTEIQFCVYCGRQMTFTGTERVVVKTGVKITDEQPDQTT